MSVWLGTSALDAAGYRRLPGSAAAGEVLAGIGFAILEAGIAALCRLRQGHGCFDVASGLSVRNGVDRCCRISGLVDGGRASTGTLGTGRRSCQRGGRLHDLYHCRGLVLHCRNDKRTGG